MDISPKQVLDLAAKYIGYRPRIHGSPALSQILR